MVVRHHEIDFASGALVFPGGKVDEAGCRSGLGPSWRHRAASAPDRAFLVAAARETFEEAGLMLARRRRWRRTWSGPPMRTGWSRPIARACVAGETTFLDLVRNEDLRLATDLMVPFAHWITPEAQPKRFDTHFLLVSAPVEQLGAHDGAESVEGFWIAPRAGPARCGGGHAHVAVPHADEPAQARPLRDRGRGGGGDARRAPSSPSRRGSSARRRAARCTSPRKPATASPSSRVPMPKR